ncbi:MAG: PDGLE domain-containing protein, partial [Rubrivivax sp.]|nr:PDGLE domain-containing protein [Rubrivivax sp.]
ILWFIARAQPDLVATVSPASAAGTSMKPLLAALAIATTVTAGAVSSFASSAPDGLEWSIAKVAGTAQMAAPASGVHGFLGQLQERMSFLPDYQLPGPAAPARKHDAAAWPGVDAGTSIAGLVGGAVTLLVVGLIAVLLKRQRR